MRGWVNQRRRRSVLRFDRKKKAKPQDAIFFEALEPRQLLSIATDLGVSTVNETGDGAASAVVTAESLESAEVLAANMGVEVGATQIVDVSDPGFSVLSPTGAWNYSAGNTLYYNGPGTGTEAVQWVFTDLEPGKYRVSVNYLAWPGRASDAPYTVIDGSEALQTVDIDQRATPNDLLEDGVRWEDLGVFLITSDNLTVDLTDQADGVVIADAVRIERIGELYEVVGVNDPGFSITDPTNEWNYSAGNTLYYNAPGTGAGAARWSFNGIEPGVYRVSVNYLAWPTDRASDAPYTVHSGAEALRTVDINQRATPDDLLENGVRWEDLGNFQITSDNLTVELTDEANGVVIAGAVRIERVGELYDPIVDVNDLGFSVQAPTNAWTYSAGNTLYYNYPGSGSEAVQWAFIDLEPGKYRVSVNYLAWTDRASDGPYTVHDGAEALQTVDIDQRVTPDDFLENGVRWEDLGVFKITSDNLTVELTDQADGVVIAAAVRIERVGELYDVVGVNDPGFTVLSPTGAWNYSSNSQLYFNGPGVGLEAVEWEFNALNPGVYRVSVNYLAWPDRATDAPYTVYDGDQALRTTRLDQQSKANDLATVNGTWEDLGVFNITGDTLRVQLTDSADGYVIADEVRIYRVGDLPASETSTIDNFEYNWGSTGSIFNTTYYRPVLGQTETSIPWRRSSPATSSGIHLVDQNGNIPPSTITKTCTLVGGTYPILSCYMSHSFPTNQRGRYDLSWPTAPDSETAFAHAERVFSGPTNLTGRLAAIVELRSSNPGTETWVRLTVSNASTTYQSTVPVLVPYELQDIPFIMIRDQMELLEGADSLVDVLTGAEAIGLRFETTGSDYTESIIFDNLRVTEDLNTTANIIPVLEEDFESGLGIFTLNNNFPGTGTGLWHRSTGRQSDGLDNHSPQHSLYYGQGEGDLGGGNYAAGTATRGGIYSHYFTLPSDRPYTLSFSYYMDTPYGDFQVAIQELGGAVDTRLNFVQDDSGGQWLTATIDLTDYAGEKIRMRFIFDSLFAVDDSYEGLYIDDIVID